MWEFESGKYVLLLGRHVSLVRSSSDGWQMKKIMDFLKGNVKLGSFFGSTLF
jgi:hypothetical protein